MWNTWRILEIETDKDTKSPGRRGRGQTSDERGGRKKNVRKKRSITG